MDTSGRTIHLFTALIVLNTDSAQVDLECTVDKEVTSESDYFTHDVLRGITTTTGSLVEGPISAVRLNVSDYKSGTIKLKVLQS